MITTDNSVPNPDLRIVDVRDIHPHEEHDSQRSEPLIESLKKAVYFTNPPIVASMPNGGYVVLDGANRYHCFSHLGYQHLLVQVVDYDKGFVQLSVWNHVVTHWDLDEFVAEMEAIPQIKIKHGWNNKAVAQIMLKNGQGLTIDAPNETVEERNSILRQIVRTYRSKARLSRTALNDPLEIWSLYPEAVAVVVFPHYKPSDIMAATNQHAFLPPGVSRHIVQGRALKLNYPLEKLRDTNLSLDEKNAALQDWLRFKLANRAVRYYAESTYQFDE